MHFLDWPLNTAQHHIVYVYFVVLSVLTATLIVAASLKTTETSIEFLRSMGAESLTGRFVKASVIALLWPLIISARVVSIARRSRRARSFMLDLLLPARLAKDAQANLHDILPIWVEEYGWSLAKLLYHKEVVGIVWGHWGGRIMSLGKTVLRMVQGS